MVAFYFILFFPWGRGKALLALLLGLSRSRSSRHCAVRAKCCSLPAQKRSFLIRPSSATLMLLLFFHQSPAVPGLVLCALRAPEFDAAETETETETGTQMEMEMEMETES